MLYTGMPRAAASRFMVPPPLITRSDNQIRLRPSTARSGMRILRLSIQPCHFAAMPAPAVRCVGARLRAHLGALPAVAAQHPRGLLLPGRDNELPLQVDESSQSDLPYSGPIVVSV